MLISLKNEHKKHLAFFINKSNQVLIEFCKTALDYLQNGPNAKKFDTAANKLDCSSEEIQKIVEALVNLLIEFGKNNADDSEFKDSILAIGFSEEHADVLSQFYQTKKSEISSVIQTFAGTSMFYKNCEWRIEAQVASRVLRHQAKPLVTLELTTEEKVDAFPTVALPNAKEEKNVFTLEISDVVELLGAVEDMITESRMQRTKYITRRLKHLDNE